MATNRRKFITAGLMGGLAATLPLSSFSAETHVKDQHPDYIKLDEAMNKPVLKRELFTSPVIIETLELLRYEKNFICRIRSKDGAEGIAVGNNNQLKSLYPIFVNRIQPFFIGKDARDIELLIEQVCVYESNYKMQSLALWVPLATVEFAILDMLGHIAGRSIGRLIGEIHNPSISVYQANGERDITAEETIDHLHQQLEESNAKAIKFKLGGRMSHPEYPVGRSEKLIPLVRKTFGDKMIISADANGSYTAEEAIRIGKIMQDHHYAFFEEPVPFDWYEETKQVADALKIPIAGGEQEASLHNFRWLVGNSALSIVQQDMFYFGGMVRSMKVARMAEVMGKQCIPHISSTGLGFLYMMHFVSAIPNSGPHHEFKEFNHELPFTCKTSTLLSKDGTIDVPTGPGLGIEIDPDYIKKHVVVKG